MNRPSIGLAVIALNEAKNLRQLTKSIKGCFDQMVLVDTGSKDKTVEIAKELGWQVENFKWVDDFSTARNHSFSFLKTDYAMWLDLDDTLQDAERFIQWRDTLMGTGDFFFATYNYAQDVRGRPVCSHARERVVRLSKGFRWNFFIHEGLVPIDPYTSMNSQMVTSWSVQHMRTLEDLNRDKGRNLMLFEKNKDNLPTRLQWYYGKELFESGNYVEAIAMLKKAAGTRDLEHHDRTLALQYLAESYMRAGQPEQCIAIAHQGLQIDPNRAELWSQIANAYLVKQMLPAAIPFLNGAKNCQIQGDPSKNQSGAIFVSEDCYGKLPRQQLAKVYSHLQRWDEAEREAKEAVKLYDDPESKAILSEVSRIKNSTIEISDAPRDLMDEIWITIPSSVPYEFDPDLKHERGMGGSETALVEMARELAKAASKPVKVFTPRRSRPEMVRDNVHYVDIMRCPEYFSKFEPRVHIAWRHNLPITKAKTLIWCHDLSAIGIEHTSRYHKVLALSQFHKAFLIASQGLPPEKIFVTRNGLAESDILIIDVPKDPNKIIFSSSPDRGLDRAIKAVEMARETLPNLELHVFYGFELMRRVNPSGCETLERMAYQRPWVKMHGNLKKPELMRHFAEGAIWLYPTNFLETFCITAIEALAYGCYPIVRKYGALQDTLKEAHDEGRALLIDNFAETEDELKVFANAVIEAITEKRYARPLANHDFMAKHSWATIAREWQKAFLNEG